MDKKNQNKNQSNENLNPNERMTRAQAADYLGISVRTLYTLSVVEGKIPYYKLRPERKNSPVWYLKKDLDDWLESRRIN